MKLLIALLLSAGLVLPDAPAQDERAEIPLPVFMYHRLLKHPTTNDIYTISPEAFEQDLIFLRDNGYTAIDTQELLDYAENGTPLPDKPVILTFDDGHYNNLYYAAPLLEKYGMKAVIFVVGQYSDLSSTDCADNPNYSYIRWECMEDLPECVEIQNHTWNMHKLRGGRTGIKRRTGESKADYESALREDLAKLNDKIALHTGKIPVAFAVPFGAEEKWAYPVLEAVNIKMCFCSEEGVSVIKRGDMESLRHIKRVVRKPGRSIAAYLKK